MPSDRPVPSRRTPLARARHAWSAAWDEPPPADPPVRVWRDSALVGVLVPALVIEGLLRPELPWRWLQVAAALVLVPTLLWRRTHPLFPVVATTVVSTALMLVMGNDGDLITAVYGAVLVYALFRWGSGRQALIGAGLLVGGLGLTWALGHATSADTIGGASVVAMLAATGLAVRFRSTARERALTQARAQERERIARDMHDVVGHHVSGIAVRAQAGLAQAEALRRGLGGEHGRDDGGTGDDGDGGDRLASLDDDPLVAALRVIEAEARNTLVEMRALVRTLREDEQGPDGAARVRVFISPASAAARNIASGGTSADDGIGNGTGELGPRAADVVRLAAGPPSPVIVTVRGEVGSVRDDVGAAAYRIAQESVTNARRHARGLTRIDVGLTVAGGALRLRVCDDGEPLTEPFVPGNGIAGMRARAQELDGDLTVGPELPEQLGQSGRRGLAEQPVQPDLVERPDVAGGWVVEAALPLAGRRP
ncbi:sensor histidine kinase [Promicromonospora sp. Populi]|uniref:sensor histidine kinase n=1 Tax=Promicromonospora sp. Populi TaxID=3239420 RepID=UPI0034E29B0B